MSGPSESRRELPHPSDTESGLATHLRRSHNRNHPYMAWSLWALRGQHVYEHECCDGTCSNHVHPVTEDDR